MKLLTLYFVDDEPIIIKGLLETYDWEKMGFKVIGWARDGVQALPDIIEKNPDVVLTDVKMKKMDGLTLIQKIKEANLKTKFVVISAYRDFEYAQTACQNGAHSYLLKPIEDEELEKVMSSLYESCTEEKYREENYSLWKKILLEDQDNFLSQMVGNYLEDAVEEKELADFMKSLLKNEDMEQHFFAVAAVGIDLMERVVNQKEYNLKQYLLESSLYKSIKESYRVWVKRNPEALTCLIIDLGTEAHLEGIKNTLNKTRKEMDGNVIFALSSEEQGFLGMKNAYNQVLKLYEIASEAGADMLLMNDKIQMQLSHKYSLDLETQILSAIRKNDQKQLKKAFGKFVYTLPDSENGIRIYLRRLAVRIEFAMNDSMGNVEELSQSFQSFYDSVEHVTSLKLVNILYRLCEHLIEWKKEAPVNESDEYFVTYVPVAISYIKGNLQDENLSITSVSEYVHLNPVYFGRLFKKVMKVSFKRYVQNLRIERAKELLTEENHNVVEVCNKVGIPNPSYFSQIFKQSTGILPSEYKRSKES